MARKKTDEEWAKELLDTLDAAKGMDTSDSRKSGSVDVQVGDPTFGSQSDNEFKIRQADDMQRKQDDAELAKRVLESTGRGKTFHGQLDNSVSLDSGVQGVDVTPGIPRINSRDGVLTTPEGKKTGIRPAPVPQTDEEWARAVQAKADAEKDAKNAGSVDVQIGEPVIKRNVEGSVYLKNTTPDGGVEKGMQVARKDFKDDSKFDEFVAHQKEQGNLWDPEKDKPSGDGGSFFSKVKQMVNGAIPRANAAQSLDSARALSVADVGTGAAMPSGAGGGGGNDGSSMAGMQAGVPASAFSSPNVMAPTLDPGAAAQQLGAQTGSLFRDSSSQAPMGGPQSPAQWAAGGPSWGAAAAPAQPEIPPYAAAPQAAPQPPAGPSMPSAPGFAAPANYNSRLQDAVDQQISASKGAADVMSAQAQHEGQIRQAQENEISKAQLRAQQQQEFQQERSQALFDSTAKAQEVLNNPAKTPDPERYWNSHSKIMFALGVGLLAQAGKDINGVLASTNQAIDRDIAQQKAQFEAPRDAARAKIAGNSTLYGMLRQQGHDAFEATKMAEALSADFYSNQLAKLAANSNSDLVKQNAAGAQAQFQQKGLEAMQAADQHARTAAVAEYNAKTNRMELGVKMQAHGAAQKAVGDNTLETLGRMRTAIEQLGNSGEKIFGGLGKAAINTISSAWPSGTTEAGQWDRTRDAKSRILMNIINPKERQNETERRNILETLVPKAGDADGQVRWDNTIQLIGNIFDNEVGALETRGQAGSLKKFTNGANSSAGGKPGWFKPY